MKSSIGFVSYKIDTLSLEIKKMLGVVAKQDFWESWEVTIALRKPQYFTKTKQYLVGIECTMTYSIPRPDNERAGTNSNVQKTNLNPEREKIVELKAAIGGLFVAEDGRFEPELEKNLIKFQTPTILMPYLRGAMTSLLANAGIGTVIFPLVNLHDVAKETMTGEDILIRD